MLSTGNKTVNKTDKVPVLKELTIYWKNKYLYKYLVFLSIQRKLKQSQKESGGQSYFIEDGE